MPLTGFLSARLGRKRVFMWSVVGFTIASMLCGAAQNLSEIVIFRLLQGIFGASLVPLSQAVLLDAYPRDRHGSAMALWGVGVMVGPILGPSLGGWLTEYYNWRWVFYINLPFGMLAWFGLAAFVHETAIDRLRRFDLLGFALLSIGIGSLQMMLDRGESLDWFTNSEVVIEACWQDSLSICSSPTFSRMHTPSSSLRYSRTAISAWDCFSFSSSASFFLQPWPCCHPSCRA
jgi:DHA2 family multidrug resistance protein